MGARALGDYLWKGHLSNPKNGSCKATTWETMFFKATNSFVNKRVQTRVRLHIFRPPDNGNKKRYKKYSARIFSKNENCQQKSFFSWPTLIPYNFDPTLYRYDYILQQQWGNNIKWVVPIFKKKGYAMACLLKNVIEIMINQCA